MSTQEPTKITKKYSFYNENLEPEEKTVEVPFTEAKTYEEAVSRLGNDTASLTRAINATLRRQALKAEMLKVRGQGISSKVLMEFIRPYREVPKFKAVTDWTEQTKMILSEIKNVSFILDAVRAKSAAEGDEEED